MRKPPFLSEAFNDMAPRLIEILDAPRCREPWLQAELFRFYRGTVGDADFTVNCRLSGGRDLVDIRGSLPREWVAELKLYGLNYLNKNLAGRSNISRFAPTNSRSRIHLEERDLHEINPREDSLLRDVSRLRSLPLEHRFMILVLDTRSAPTAFGDAIRAIRLSSIETTWSYSGFQVRIWRI